MGNKNHGGQNMIKIETYWNVNDVSHHDPIKNWDN